MKKQNGNELKKLTREQMKAVLGGVQDPGQPTTNRLCTGNSGCPTGEICGKLGHCEPDPDADPDLN